jgi:hypothetical protein
VEGESGLVLPFILSAVFKASHPTCAWTSPDLRSVNGFLGTIVSDDPVFRGEAVRHNSLSVGTNEDRFGVLFSPVPVR